MDWHESKCSPQILLLITLHDVHTDNIVDLRHISLRAYQRIQSKIVIVIYHPMSSIHTGNTGLQRERKETIRTTPYCNLACTCSLRLFPGSLSIPIRIPILAGTLSLPGMLWKHKWDQPHFFTGNSGPLGKAPRTALRDSALTVSHCVH